MQVHDDGLVPVELKYCERCGALWFRSSGGEEVYCPSCIPKMAEFPEPKRELVVGNLQVSVRVDRTASGGRPEVGNDLSTLLLKQLGLESVAAEEAKTETAGSAEAGSDPVE